MSKTAALNINELVGTELEFAAELGKLLRDKAAHLGPLKKVAIASAVLQRDLGSATREAKLAQALARGISVREKMATEEGGSMSAEETARYLDTTKQSVLTLYHNAKLLGWRTEKQGAIRFPIWQFADHQRLPGLLDVLAVLEEPKILDDWGKIGFFLQTHGILDDCRPLDLLRKSQISPVIKAAAEYVG
jgi:hypothetical protein